MDVTTFLFLLTGFSVLTGLVTECVKKLVSDKANLSMNIVALAVAVIIGVVGTLIYYQLNSIELTINNIIYSVLLGLASALCATVGYDKVKQAIEQLTKV